MSFLAPSYQGGLSGQSSYETFPDPFYDQASRSMPSSLQAAFRACERIMLEQGIYRSAIDRIVSYFLTEVEISDTDRDTKELYKDFLHNDLGIIPLLRYIALDYITYGNSIISVIEPMRRYLRCPTKGCGTIIPLRQVIENPRFKFKWSNFQFNATCPSCDRRGNWVRVDRQTKNERDVVVKRWNIHEIELLWDPHSDAIGHIWKIPEYYKERIRSGRKFVLERAPWQVVEAVKNGSNIEFNEELVYHCKEDTLSGVKNQGWGISRVLTNFRQAWYVQVLHKYNEAIGMDYIIPFRVITPDPRPGGDAIMSDPLFSTDLGGFTGQVSSMLQRRREDPASWHMLPFPVKYQMLGGEANQLAPHQLMEQAQDTLLASVGIPVQFYRGDLTVQAAPAALRLLESHWSHLTYMMNSAVQWNCDKISQIFSWDKVTAYLERPSHMDDLNRQLAKLQLMSSQLISRTTGLKSVGLDFAEEQRRSLEEEKFVAEESQKAQEELEMSGLGQEMSAGAPPAQGAMPAGGAPPAQGAMPAGGAPAGGDPTQGMQPVDPIEAIMAQIPQGTEANMSITDLHGIAQTLAEQIFGLPAPQRISALRQLKERSPAVHSLVKSLLQEKETQAEAQGRQMLRQQAQAVQGQSMAPPPPMQM